MGEVLTHSKITSLDLGPLWTTTETLVRFLKVHMRAVRSLRLFRVGLEASERSQDYAWQEILPMMVAELKLSKVEVFQVWRADQVLIDEDESQLWTQQFVDTKHADEPLILNGITAIKEGLSELASNGAYLADRPWFFGEWPSDDCGWSDEQGSLVSWDIV
ncbi:hypothetical protein LTR27_006212 [Elasticomyces elasticus]|nr:hypothetical protein LTR27_006212 [Elasticomyces elasticus]